MRTTSIALICLAIPCLGFANEPRYTFVEGAYQLIELDTIDGDGWFVAGSVAVGNRVHLLASYANIGFDFGIDADTLRVGVGLHHPLTQSLHLVGETGYARAGVDTPFGDSDDSGYFVSGGVRWMVTPRVELTGLLNYAELKDSGFGTSFASGMLFHLTRNLAVSAAVDVDSDAVGYNAGLRYYF
jgi:hypothetical protein